MQAHIGEPDPTPHSVASGLGLHCYPMSHKKDLRGLILFCVTLLVDMMV